MNDLPVTRIDDVLVHPRDNDLVLATHGRSVMVMDDITPLQGLTDEVLASDAHLFEPRDAVLWKRDARLSRSVVGNKTWQGENAPVGTSISYYLADSERDGVQLTITDLRSGDVFRGLEGPGEVGLNRVQWDLRGNQRAAPGGGRGGFTGRGGRGGGRPTASPGVYRVTLSVNGRDYSTTVNVLEDIWMGQR